MQSNISHTHLVCISTCLFLCMRLSLSAHLTTDPSVRQCIHRTIYPSIHPHINRSFLLLIYLVLSTSWWHTIGLIQLGFSWLNTSPVPISRSWSTLTLSQKTFILQYALWIGRSGVETSYVSICMCSGMPWRINESLRSYRSILMTLLKLVMQR